MLESLKTKKNKIAFPFGKLLEKKKFSAKKKFLLKKIFETESRLVLAFFNTAPETSDVSWANTMFLSIMKCPNKSGPFEHAQSMSKWPTGSVI